MDVNNPLSQSIAEQLFEQIKGKGIVLQGIAERTGISIGSLSRYINGKRDLPTPIFALICKDVGLDAGEVLRNALEVVASAKQATDQRSPCL
ncbi:hypothetical protein [Glutamicibacter arilaitensis]|uniref:hypothetical protein n=1 Tax=Glutamicibacter arilaitensis TaxID=256701 RepID=UPI003FD50751